MNDADKEAYEATFTDLERELARLDSMQDAKLRKIATICNAALALRERLKDGEVVWLNHRLHDIANAHGLPDDCVLEDDQTFAGQTLDASSRAAS